MNINGEAIYGTRPVAPHREGKLRLTQGKDGTVYAIYLADEGEERIPGHLFMMGLRPAEGAQLSLLGVPGTLKWKAVGSGFIADVPERARSMPPSQHAWVLKISRVAQW